MELTHELRENAGFQWVLERLSREYGLIVL